MNDLELHKGYSNTSQLPKASFIALQKYIPENVWKRLKKGCLSCKPIGLVKIEDYLEELFKVSLIDMRRYGSAKQLGFHITIFRNFPGAQNVFENARCDLFRTSIIMYYNCKGDPFMYKQDLYIHAEYFLLKNLVCKPEVKNIVVLVLVAQLKDYQTTINSKCEMLPVSDEITKRLSRTYDAIVESEKNEDPEIIAEDEARCAPRSFCYEDILAKMKQLIPQWNDSHHALVMIELQRMCQENPPETSEPLFRSLLINVNRIVNLVVTFVRDNRHLFFPDHSDEKFLKPRNVSMFKHGNRKFVFKRELEEIMPIPENLKSNDSETVDEALARQIVENRPNKTIKVEFTDVKLNKKIPWRNQLELMIKPRQFFNPPQTTRYLRLFQDGDQKFVMAAELARYADVPEDKLSAKHLTTITEEEASRIIKDHPHYSTPIEFVIVPIGRAKHSAVPIRTPDKGHCKLASDLFSELVQDLIFGTGIFQKIRKKEWSEVEKFFDKLGHLFNPEEKEPYFIQLDDFENDKTMISNYFEDFGDRPVKINRNAKADGFTVQNLKNELVYLGFAECFPGITNLADVVYEHVVKEKTENVLTTSDLFDALEYCVRISLYQKSEKISKFMQNQKGRYHHLLTICNKTPLPMSTTSTNRYKHTKMKSYSLDDVEVAPHSVKYPITKQLEKQIICPNGDELIYNNVALATKISTETKQSYEKIVSHLEVFLVSEKEAEYAHREYQKVCSQAKKASAMILDVFRTVTEFVKIVPNKSFYLRTISTNVINPEADRMVFVEEIMRVIPILLKQQGNSEKEELVKNMIADWVSAHNDHVSMSIDNLDMILGIFDIDKSRITLVPDPDYAFSVKIIFPLNTGYPSLVTLSPTRENILDCNQAVFKIFQDIVCDIDWSRGDFDCKDSKIRTSKYAFKVTVLKEMKKISDYANFVSLIHVEKIVATLKKCADYTVRKKKKLLTPHIKLFDAEIYDSVSLSFFLSECKNFGLSYQAPPGVGQKELDHALIPVWKVRLLFLVEWSKMLFDLPQKDRKEYGSLEAVIRAGIYRKVPLDKWKNESDFMDVILGLKPEIEYSADILVNKTVSFLTPEKGHEWLENTSWRDRSYVKRLGVLEFNELIRKTAERSDDLRVVMRAIEEQPKIMERVLEMFRKNWSKSTPILRGIVTFSTMTKKEQTEGSADTKDQKNSVVEGSSQVGNTAVHEGKVEEKPETVPPNDSKDVVQPKKVHESPDAPTPTVSADSTEAQRKEMDEMKQMIKMLQEEVYGKKKSTRETATVSKTVPLETYQNEVKELKLQIDQFHKKFQRASVLCNERTAELKTATQKLEKLKKQESSAEKTLKEIREKEKGKPTREQLEKELEKMKKERATEQDEFQKKMEAMEKEKVEQASVQEQSAETIRQLTQELERQRLTSTSEADRMNIRIAELESFYSESQQRIRLLKDQLPKETVESFNFRPSLEMRKTLGKLRTDQDPLLSGKHSDIALRKVLKLQKMTEDPKVHDLADYYLTDYNEKLSEFSGMISENIRRIQANPLTTQAELLPYLEFPKLNDYIDNEITKAQQAINEKIERECMCCMTEEEQVGGWWRCSGCLKKSHLVCLEQAVDHSGLNICPHCRCAIVE